MKSNYIFKITFVAFVGILLLLPPSRLMAGDSCFEIGKKYRIEYFKGSGVISVLSKPDDFGWIKVKMLQGEKQDNFDMNFKSLNAGDEGFLNIQSAIGAKKLD